MNRKMLLRIATAVGSLLTAVNPVLAQGTAFTYQGRLNDGASPANGSYDLTFALFSVVSGPGQAGSTVTNSAVAVSNGLFTVVLDFGNQFPGAARWLEVGVRTNGNGAFVTLIPRQPLTPTPYAVTAENLISAGLAGTYTNAVALNNTNNVFTGNGAGLAGVNAGTVGGLGAEALWQTGAIQTRRRASTFWAQPTTSVWR